MNLTLKVDIDPTDLRQAVADHLINIAHDIVGKPYELKPASTAAELPKFIKIGANGLALPADYLGTDHVAFYVRSRNIWMTARKIHRDRQSWKAGEKLCAECSLLGFRDWRYPDIEDWEAVRDLTKFSPAADTNILPDLDCAAHWSRTPYAGDKDSGAWYFVAGNGAVGTFSRSLECFVLAVRSASPPSQ